MLLAPAVAAANLTNCTPVVTACCKDDGFGAHYFAMIRIFSYAVAKQIAYCTSPWGDQGRMNHHADATQMWEFIGGDFLGERCSSLPVGEGKYCEPTQYLAGPGAEVTEEAFTTARLKILAAYHSTPKPYLWESDARHLAVHVRRGDVTEEKYGDTDRWVSNQDVAECIERAYIEMGGEDVEVHIFSEGHVDDFPELKQIHPKGHPAVTPTFHLNTPANHLPDMFNRFVSADGFLLGARSRDSPRVHPALPLRSAHRRQRTAHAHPGASSLSGAAAYLRGRQDFYTFEYCTRARVLTSTAPANLGGSETGGRTRASRGTRKESRRLAWSLESE